MAIDLKLTSGQKKAMSGFVKPQPAPKLLNPKEKIAPQPQKDFYPRGN
jgi:hypothetical protein